ncbi:MAG: tripartite tricarboxylate transporter permease [Candidatus Nanoarchaeia archaeon]
MLIQLILFLFLGIVFGTITGLIPGIHINLIGVFLVSLSASFLAFLNPLYFITFIVSMAITHTFIDFIPSIFLGAPDTDTELSILPGHQLLNQGQGYQAIILTTYGSLIAVFVLVLIAWPSIFTISKIYNIIEILIPYLLITASTVLIFLERKKLSALGVFLLTGLLGIIIFQLGNQELLNQPLLPLLTGLFGGSTLLLSIKNKSKIPSQKISKPKIKFLKPLIGAGIASPLCSFLPGLGSGQAAVIGNSLLGKSSTTKKEFLILLGTTNTLVMGFSFIALFTISRTRTGAAVAIQDILGNFSIKILILILSVVFISGIASFFLTIFLAKIFSKRIEHVNYTFLSTLTLVILMIIVLLISGFLGIIVLILSTLTGIYCIGLKVRRTHMMGCLLLPTILFYLI